ncbi:protein transport protein Sec24C [Neolamprologus brichardi]|uniref:protein transport protein Sec24C n=1 Tax=Neolamprologus brichardi TaxID=32507 RepID=UPI0003EC64D2|nr:protein transport protein Sec24C [Neolamprologus brichardi]
MMDVPSANQSQTPCQPWAGQKDWSTASPPRHPFNPLPSFQHLNLMSPSDYTPCYNHLQMSSSSFQRDFTAFSPNNNNPHNSLLHVNNTNHSVQPVIPDVSATIPAARRGSNMNEDIRPCDTQWTSLHSPPNPYQAVAQHFQHPYTQQDLVNGPQSPHQNHLPIRPPLYGNESPQCIPQPGFEGANARSSAVFTHNHASPTSPIQQQPQWTLPAQSGENINQFVPTAAAQVKSFTPQSPNSESRYGLDPELLPSAVKVMTEDKAEWEGKVFTSEPFSSLPPLATTSCIVEDRVPWQHYQPTNGVNGVRVDKEKRPELSTGSYEILNSQKGEAAALLLAIDVSVSALRGGHLEFVTQQIQMLLNSMNREDGDALDVRVGLMTYDSRIHLYDLSPELSRPHMLVITETDDLQLPVREGLLVPLKDCISSIDSVLQLVPQFNTEGTDSGGVPMELPVKAGLAVLQGLGCPGKLLIFHTTSLIETGHTSSGFFGTNKPKSIFQPSEQAVSVVKECVGQGCGVHLFVLSHQDVGGAWPGDIPYLTGGALHTYSHLQGELDRERFSTDLKRTVETHTGYKAELRIFVSKDLRVSGCYGLFVPGSNPGRVTLATLDTWTTLAVELAHTRALDETRGVAIQVVLSYTLQTGDRRTRVHTLTLRCSRQLQDTFRHYQAQTLLTFYCKKSKEEELQTEVTEALASYRKHCCSASVSAGQLVLPQYLRALPVYINSLMKSELLLPGLRSSIHQRLQRRCQVLRMDTCSTATHFYPLLLPLPLSTDGSNPPKPEEALRCSAASLEPRGLYLVHTPLTLLLWVGTQVPACTLVELFNTSCFSSLPSGETKLPVLENHLSIGIRSLINTLNSGTSCTRKLWVVKQGDSCEEALQRHLVEDKSPNGGASYADFLYHLHVNSVRLLQ